MDIRSIFNEMPNPDTKSNENEEFLDRIRKYKEETIPEVPQTLDIIFEEDSDEEDGEYFDISSLMDYAKKSEDKYEVEMRRLEAKRQKEKEEQISALKTEISLTEANRRSIERKLRDDKNYTIYDNGYLSSFDHEVNNLKLEIETLERTEKNYIKLLKFAEEEERLVNLNIKELEETNRISRQTSDILGDLVIKLEIDMEKQDEEIKYLEEKIADGNVQPRKIESYRKQMDIISLKITEYNNTRLKKISEKSLVKNDVENNDELIRYLDNKLLAIGEDISNFGELSIGIKNIITEKTGILKKKTDHLTKLKTNNIFKEDNAYDQKILTDEIMYLDKLKNALNRLEPRRAGYYEESKEDKEEVKTKVVPTKITEPKNNFDFLKTNVPVKEEKQEEKLEAAPSLEDLFTTPVLSTPTVEPVAKEILKETNDEVKEKIVTYDYDDAVKELKDHLRITALINNKGKIEVTPRMISFVNEKNKREPEIADLNSLFGDATNTAI